MTGAPATEHQARQDLLWAQVRAIEAGPAARRRRFRRLELICTGCEQVLVEVFATSPCPCLLYRRTDRYDIGEQRAVRRAASRRLFALTPEHEQLVGDNLEVTLRVVCACSQAALPFAEVYSALRRGVKRLALPPRTLS